MKMDSHYEEISFELLEVLLPSGQCDNPSYPRRESTGGCQIAVR